MISLVGFMGCGKSTLGPLLALCLELPFRDLDREVEEEAGCSLVLLFEREGEQGFRARELRAFRRLAASFSGVLATGGGLAAQPGLARELRAAGPVLFLDPPWEELLERLRRQGPRPPLRGRPEEEWRALHGQRREAYLAAGRRVELPACEETARQLDRLLAAVKEESGMKDGAA